MGCGGTGGEGAVGGHLVSGNSPELLERGARLRPFHRCGD